MIATSEASDASNIYYAETDAGWVQIVPNDTAGTYVLIADHTRSDCVEVFDEPPSKKSEADDEKKRFLSVCYLAIEIVSNRQWLGRKLGRRNGKGCDSPLIRIGRYTSGFV